MKQSSVILMCNGGFIFAICLLRELPALIKREREPDTGYLLGAFIGFSMFALGLSNLIFGVEG